MEEMTMMMRTKKQTGSMHKHNSATTLSNMHKNSHTISKPPPKIRIIHIFAPEIIKTDVANFRELVQRLTGKPPPTTATTTKKSSTREEPKKKKAKSTAATFYEKQQQQQQQVQMGYQFNGGLECSRERVKEEEEEEEEEEEMMMWRERSNENSSASTSSSLTGGGGGGGGGGGFLNGFGDLDGFMQELGSCEFPFMFPPSSNHMHHLFGETQLLS